MYIDFDEYPRYSGKNSEIFENVNKKIQCVHSYAYSLYKQKMCTWVNVDSSGMMKNCLMMQNQKKMPKNCFMQRMYTFSKRYK